MDRGAVLAEPGVLAVEEISLDAPGPGEVLLRLAATGVCHTDLHVLETGWGMPMPVLLGHEGAGYVEAVGDGVEGLREGDLVVPTWLAPCGECRACARGNPRRCRKPLGAGRRLHRAADGAELTPVLRCGTFATRTIVSAGAVVPVPAGLPAEQACLLGCAVATGVGSVLEVARVWEGARVAVIGCGAVGLSVVQGARIAGAAEIYAIDLDERKAEQALAFGATATGVPERRVDFAFDVVGQPATFEQAVGLLDNSGTAVLVGVPMRGDATLGMVPLFNSRGTIRVSHGGDHLPAVDIPRLAAWALEGRLDLAGMISRRISLDDLDEAFEEMKRGDVIRSVIVFE